ncbi:hypothetical protein [Streptomyces sp. HC307]
MDNLPACHLRRACCTRAKERAMRPGRVNVVCGLFEGHEGEHVWP